ncbi:alpha/beta hydrolase [Propionibacteriaceae bacterium Y1700]|uniref:alpha/beta hydrolase n=1 Tax=Microlunatus sp. Y1700 TaxID=3418487 RepID=UPI003DA78E89
MRPKRHRPVRRWLVVLCVLTLLAGCAGKETLIKSEPPPAATTAPSPAAPSSSAPSSSASSQPSGGEASTEPGGRKVLPIPDVEPEGFREPPPGIGLERYLGQEVDWTSCQGGTECAEIAVPLDHADPDGQAITLALRRARTSGTSRGTIFVNPGGPGGSGWSMVGQYAGGLFGYDVIGWDPRGVGRSTPVQCQNGADLDAYYDLDSTPDDVAEEKAMDEGNRAFAESCLAGSGRLLEHVSTVETVTDLDLMRQLVGDEKLHYLGYSYGTEIGAVYAQLFGQNVGHLVLDSAVNITDDDSVIQSQGFDRALGNFAEWCAAGNCSLGDDRSAVINSVTELWADLEAEPLPVGRRQLTQSLAVLGTLVPLYQDEGAWPYLAQALEAARAGDGEMLLGFADSYNERGSDGRYGQMLYGFNAVRCLDEADDGVEGAKRQAAEDAKKSPIFGANSGADLVCPMWPVAAREPVGKITGPEVTEPILVIGTTGDSATPYEYAQSMASQLRTGVLLTFEGEGHGAFGGGNACLDGAVRDYFVNDRPPPEGTRCS